MVDATMDQIQLEVKPTRAKTMIKILSPVRKAITTVTRWTIRELRHYWGEIKKMWKSTFRRDTFLDDTEYQKQRQWFLSLKPSPGCDYSASILHAEAKLKSLIEHFDYLDKKAEWSIGSAVVLIGALVTFADKLHVSFEQATVPVVLLASSIFVAVKSRMPSAVPNTMAVRGVVVLEARRNKPQTSSILVPDIDPSEMPVSSADVVDNNTFAENELPMKQAGHLHCNCVAYEWLLIRKGEQLSAATYLFCLAIVVLGVTKFIAYLMFR